MKVLTSLIIASFSIMSSHAAVLVSDDFSDPNFRDGKLDGQHGWQGQEFFMVQSDQVSIDYGGYPRISNTTPATDGRGFYEGDKLQISIELSFAVPKKTIQGGIFRGGILTNPSSPTDPVKPIQGFEVASDFNSKKILFSPVFMVIEGSGKKLADFYKENEKNLIAIPYDELGITDATSDLIRVNWSMVMTGTDSWNAALNVTNLKTGKVWNYTGPNINAAYPTSGDAFIGLHRNNSEEKLPLHIDALTYLYSGLYATETLGLLATF